MTQLSLLPPGMELPTRCEKCNAVFPLYEADVIGADDGNIFCPECGQEIYGEDVVEGKDGE